MPHPRSWGFSITLVISFGRPNAMAWLSVRYRPHKLGSGVGGVKIKPLGAPLVWSSRGMPVES